MTASFATLDPDVARAGIGVDVDAHPLVVAREPLPADVEVDACGSFFPGALFELVRVVRDARPGSTVALLVRDPVAREEIPSWAARRGHAVLAVEDMSADGHGAMRFVLRISVPD